ncbi:hypothetical protein LTR37_009801 [Vermiconidia calcicola]|uniref:Uncharacterized protein n=1 Tax=Vermiconidia calcicola TaxID=1690605 RepID=A0ACC3N6K6_9PEZI|nr:hypothetical protein LTR37_009801 [Vermiconidia calcicola]
MDSASSPSEPPVQTSGLFSLPAELRNEIYMLAGLIRPNTIPVTETAIHHIGQLRHAQKTYMADRSKKQRRALDQGNGGFDNYEDRETSTRREILPQTLQPALTRVCKQMRSETLPMFYGSNTFKLYIDAEKGATPSFRVMRRWLRYIGAENRQWVEKVVVCTRVPEADLLRSFKNRILHRISPEVVTNWGNEAADEDNDSCVANWRGACLTHYRICVDQ